MATATQPVSPLQIVTSGRRANLLTITKGSAAKRIQYTHTREEDGGMIIAESNLVEHTS